MRHGRGLNDDVGGRRAPGVIVRARVVVPHQGARPVVCRSKHVALGRSRRRDAEVHLDVIVRHRVLDDVARRRARHAVKHVLAALVFLHRLAGEQRVGDGCRGAARDRLRAAQLLERRYRGRTVDRRALRDRGRVKGAVLDAQLHGRGGGRVVAERVRCVVAKRARHKHHVVHRCHGGDVARARHCRAGVAVVQEAHPEGAQVVVVLRDKVELLVVHRPFEGRAHGDPAAASVATVLVLVRHLAKAHCVLVASREAADEPARHVDPAVYPVLAVHMRRRPARDHIARRRVGRHFAVARPVRLHVGRARRRVVVLDAPGLAHALAARDGDGQAVVPVVHEGAVASEVLARGLEVGRGRSGEHDAAALLGAAALHRAHRHAAVVLDVAARRGRALCRRRAVLRDLRVDLVARRRVEGAHLEVLDHQLLPGLLALDHLRGLVLALGVVLDHKALLVGSALHDRRRDLAVGVGAERQDRRRGRRRRHARRRQQGRPLVDAVDVELDARGRVGRRGLGEAVAEGAHDIVHARGGVHGDRGNLDLPHDGRDGGLGVQLVQPHRAPVLAKLGDEAHLAIVNSVLGRRRAKGAVGRRGVLDALKAVDGQFKVGGR